MNVNKKFIRPGNTKFNIVKTHKLNIKQNDLNKTERREKMIKLFLKNRIRYSASAFILMIIFMTTPVTFTGCNDNGMEFPLSANSEITAAGGNINDFKNKNLNTISLDLTLQFRKEIITETKFLESNIGNSFNNIVPVTLEIKPGIGINLEELQEAGIFGLYLRSDEMFTLSNSDGMSISVKSLLMEKCSFIDLKVTNYGQNPIKVTGLIAGE